MDGKDIRYHHGGTENTEVIIMKDKKVMQLK